MNWHSNRSTQHSNLIPSAVLSFSFVCVWVGVFQEVSRLQLLEGILRGRKLHEIPAQGEWPQLREQHLRISITPPSSTHYITSLPPQLPWRKFSQRLAPATLVVDFSVLSNKALPLCDL